MSGLCVKHKFYSNYTTLVGTTQSLHLISKDFTIWVSCRCEVFVDLPQKHGHINKTNNLVENIRKLTDNYMDKQTQESFV